jgi:ferric-dicitrate binding protein FerR (iron transport regulator)
LKSPTGLKQKVIVTGTTFNINAYGDEPVIKTTLLEGRVIVKGEGKNIALQPGEELQMGKSKIILQLVPIEEAISWNSDSFSFVNKPAGNVLKEIARWYGLSITLEGDTSSGITLNAPRSMDPSVLVRAVFYHIKPLNGKKNIIVRPAIQKLAL